MTSTFFFLNPKLTFLQLLNFFNLLKVFNPNTIWISWNVHKYIQGFGSFDQKYNLTLPKILLFFADDVSGLPGQTQEHDLPVRSRHLSDVRRQDRRVSHMQENGREADFALLKGSVTYDVILPLISI